jgi:regulator of sigma E protease
MSLLQSGIIGVLAFIFILGAAVTLHEFGHFIVAKLLKIRVETFSLGFGPRLWGFKKGTTDYRVSAIPLGGYVKLGGDESNAPIEGESAPDIPANDVSNSGRESGQTASSPDERSDRVALRLRSRCPECKPRPQEDGTSCRRRCRTGGLKPGDRIVVFDATPVRSGKRLLTMLCFRPACPCRWS